MVVVPIFLFFFALDCATDSIAATIPVGAGACVTVVNPIQGRVYVASHEGCSISVIRDLAGIAEYATRGVQSRTPIPTIVRGVLQVDSRQNTEHRGGVELLDISGRKVLDLKPGPNDVSRLATGVYFISERTTVGNRQSAVKVVIQR